MTSLRDIVSYRNRINDLRAEFTLCDEIRSRSDRFNSVDSSPMTDKSKINEISGTYNTLMELNSTLDKSLTDLIESLDSEIDSQGKLLEQDPEYINKFNEHSWPIGLVDPYYTVNQRYLIDIQQQLTQYALWKYPGLQLYPQSKQWTDVMLANDPVYLVALAKHTLSHITEQYPTIYQNRIRRYSSALTENIVDRSLKFLPQNQFGYVIMWNTPLYLISDYLKQYLKSIFDILRPGGVCVFNYNNCNIPASAKLTEEKIFSFMTPNLITKIAQDLGFNGITFKDVALDDLTYTHVSWVELQKPGVLTTIKSHQPMAKIID